MVVGGVMRSGRVSARMVHSGAVMTRGGATRGVTSVPFTATRGVTSVPFTMIRGVTSVPFTAVVATSVTKRMT